MGLGNGTRRVRPAIGVHVPAVRLAAALRVDRNLSAIPALAAKIELLAVERQAPLLPFARPQYLAIDYKRMAVVSVPITALVAELIT